MLAEKCLTPLEETRREVLKLTMLVATSLHYLIFRIESKSEHAIRPAANRQATTH